MTPIKTTSPWGEADDASCCRAGDECGVGRSALCVAAKDSDLEREGPGKRRKAEYVRDLASHKEKGDSKR